MQACSAMVAMMDSGRDARLIQAGTCAGYVVGFINGIQAAVTASKTERLFCPPDGWTAAQMARVVHKYLTENPAELHEPALLVSFTALSRAFPCPLGR